MIIFGRWLWWLFVLTFAVFVEPVFFKLSYPGPNTGLKIPKKKKKKNPTFTQLFEIIISESNHHLSGFVFFPVIVLKFPFIFLCYHLEFPDSSCFILWSCPRVSCPALHFLPLFCSLHCGSLLSPEFPHLALVNLLFFVVKRTFIFLPEFLLFFLVLLVFVTSLCAKLDWLFCDLTLTC